MFVSNSSTLILLAKISSLRSFLEIGKKITIPNQVYDEFIKKKESFDAKLIQKEIENQKIKIEDVKKEKYHSYQEEFRLHEGEAAAYALFKKDKFRAILTDDGELIKLCKIEEAPFICSMAIVFLLYKNSKISKEEALEKIEKLYDIGRYSKEIYDYFLQKVKENGNSIS
ncbi:hypothetical protein JW930_05320 [Candidatus Woesearchaeota archaeon]|nr:hypothetical protein [Candidatus Woesearchaeota archaeon]